MSRAIKLLQKNFPLSATRSNTLSEVAVDLGSYRTRVMRPEDIEPLSIASCMVIARESQSVVSIGEEAREVVGRNSPDLEVVSPIQESFFSDFGFSKLFLTYCVGQLVGTTDLETLSLPNTMYFFVTPNFSEVQYRAVHKICRDMGIHTVILLNKPMIASLARQVKEQVPNPTSLKLLIDCGYESTHFSIIQFEKVFHFHQIWYGGKDLTEAIQSFLKSTHHLEIGAQSAEKLKQECAHILQIVPEGEVLDKKKIPDHMMVVRGRDVLTSFPKSIKVSVEEFRPLFQQFVQEVLDELAVMTERFGPELIEELIHRGFSVFGGMAVVNMLVQKIESLYGTVVQRPTQPDLVYHQGFREFFALSSKERKKFLFVPEW